MASFQVTPHAWPEFEKRRLHKQNLGLAEK